MEEAFLKANANRDYILQEFVEVLRDLIRATAAADNYQSGAFRAARQMKYVMDLIERCDDAISWQALFLSAVEQMRDFSKTILRDEMIIDTAMTGMAMVTEASCKDNLAYARFSKRQDKFLSMIRITERKRNRS